MEEMLRHKERQCCLLLSLYFNIIIYFHFNAVGLTWFLVTLNIADQRELIRKVKSADENPRDPAASSVCLDIQSMYDLVNSSPNNMILNICVSYQEYEYL